MSNLKKVLSVGLASTMVMGMVATSAAAAAFDDFTDKDEIVNKEAVSMVTELGVIAGMTDGSYAPKQNIDRASFARLVCVTLNGGKEPNLGNLKTSFTDTQGNWAEKYIAYCVDRSIIAGKGNNTFAPAANVTGSEAAKMLLVALGYNPTYEGIGGATWQVTTDVLANQAGLYDGLEKMNTSEPLTRDQAAQMIYNTLNANVVSYSWTFNANGTTVAVQNKSDKTLLEEKFGVTVVEGVVVANEYGSVVAKSAQDASKDEGKTQIEVTGDDGVSGTYSVSTGADLLGKSVTLYIDYKNAGSTSGAKVVGNAVLSDDNKVFTSLNGDSVAEVADDNDLTVDGALYFSNYAATTAANLTVKDGGELTLIDNNDDGEVDYVLYNEYTYGAVTAKSTTDDGYLTVSGIGKFEDSSKIVGFDDVEKKDMVQAIKFGGKLYVKKLTTVTGELDAYSTSKATIKIDGTEYTMSDLDVVDGSKADPEVEGKVRDYLDSDKIDVAATFYLDSNNVVVAVGDADEANLQYGVLLAAENKKGSNIGSLGTDAQAKLLLADGSKKSFDVASINGDDPVEYVSEDASSKLGTIHYFDEEHLKGVFSYTLNSDNELKLSYVGKTYTAGDADGSKNESADDVAVTFDQGKPTFKVTTKATVSNTVETYTTTNDTVFLYDDGNKITRYVGKNAAPDLDIAFTDSKVTVSVGVKGTSTATLIYVAQKPDSAAKDGDFLYLYNNNLTVVKDGNYELTALVNGVKKTVVVELDDSMIESDKTLKNDAKGLYAYSVDADGVYSLDGTKIDSSDADKGVMIGDVDSYDSDYVTVEGKDLIVNGDTVTVTAEDGKGSATEGTSIGDGDSVIAVYNSDDEVLYIIITTDADAGSGTGSTTDPSIEKVTLGGDLKVTAEFKVAPKTGTKNVVIDVAYKANTGNDNWTTLESVSEEFNGDGSTKTFTTTTAPSAPSGALVEAEITVTVDGEILATKTVSGYKA